MRASAQLRIARPLIAIGFTASAAAYGFTHQQRNRNHLLCENIPHVSQDNDPSDDRNSAWRSFSERFALAKKSILAFHSPAVVEKLTDFILPKWVNGLPDYLAKLQAELDLGDETLAAEIWDESFDVNINPEITQASRVRLSDQLCSEEQRFLELRKHRIKPALAKYLDISESDINHDDIPTLAMCGSGGGLRALVAGSSSYLSAQEAGLFDCVTYTAGVSGSCWLQALYYSSIGKQRHQVVINHLKNRLGMHIAFPPSALELLTSAPTNKYLLSGLVERLKGNPNAEFGLVDVYGMLLAARLLVPRAELDLDARDLKLSNQQRYLKQGNHPLPLYTAVRHEIPIDDVSEDGQGAKQTDEKDNRIEGRKGKDHALEVAKKEAWFQWFEFSPYEIFCEELNAGIPTFAVGRSHHRGISQPRPDTEGLYLPELRLPLLMGVWGSAFCATLSHYYKEIRPGLKGLAGFSGIDDMIEEKDQDLVKVHPIEPSTIPNFARGLKRDHLSPTCPESILKAETIQLMDAGMSNNLPIYPLLRQGRNVDVIIAFDASADVKTDNWLSVADGYARQRGIKGWPVGIGWPKEDTDPGEVRYELAMADAASADEAVEKIRSAKSKQLGDKPTRPEMGPDERTDLSYCNVWIGTSVERNAKNEPPPSKRMNPDDQWSPSSSDPGIAVIYLPFVPNPKVDGVDPNTSDFMSTWNFIYTPEQIDQVVALARANYEAGADQIKRTIRLVYERKKAERLDREQKLEAQAWSKHWKRDSDLFR